MSFKVRPAPKRSTWTMQDSADEVRRILVAKKREREYPASSLQAHTPSMKVKVRPQKAGPHAKIAAASIRRAGKDAVDEVRGDTDDAIRRSRLKKKLTDGSVGFRRLEKAKKDADKYKGRR